MRLDSATVRTWSIVMQTTKQQEIASSVAILPRILSAKKHFCSLLPIESSCASHMGGNTSRN